MSDDRLLSKCLKQVIGRNLGYEIGNVSYSTFSDVFGLDVGGIPLTEFDVVSQSPPTSSSEIHLIFCRHGCNDIRWKKLKENERAYDTSSRIIRIFMELSSTASPPPKGGGDEDLGFIEEIDFKTKLTIKYKTNMRDENISTITCIAFKGDMNNPKFVSACLDKAKKLTPALISQKPTIFSPSSENEIEVRGIGKMYFDVDTIQYIKMNSEMLEDSILDFFKQKVSLVLMYVPDVMDYSDMEMRNKDTREMINKIRERNGFPLLPEIHKGVGWDSPETINDPFLYIDNYNTEFFIKGNDGIPLVPSEELEGYAVRVANFIEPDLIIHSPLLNTTASHYKIEFSTLISSPIRNDQIQNTKVDIRKEGKKEDYTWSNDNLDIAYPPLGTDIPIFGDEGFRSMYKFTILFGKFEDRSKLYRFLNPQKEE